ncbi:hypothetical protein ACFE04_023099 [Oxalis oulophora]
MVKTGNLIEARKMFDEMPKRDEISWTNMISGYVNARDTVEALFLFSRIWVDPVFKMDPFILSLALKACGLGSNTRYGDSLHGYSIKTGLVDSVFVGTSLLDMYMKTGRVDFGRRVFDEMHNPNVRTWTAVITGLVHAGCYLEGLAYFSYMWMSKIQYDSFTFAIALKACADSGLLKTGKEVHCLAVKKSLDTCSFVANSLATLYNKCGKLNYGSRLFERMSTRDVVSWTDTIAHHIQTGQDEEAVRLFVKMKESDVKPNDYTFAAIISGCANLGRLEWGEQLHAQVLRLGFEHHLSVANSIVTMYAKCRKLTSASLVFENMTNRDIISWSTIIASYAHGDCGEKSIEYLYLMRQDGEKPSEYALSSVLSACAQMANLEQGKQMHAYSLKIGLENKALTKSALISLYAKCGTIKDAVKNFDELHNPDIVSWTAMINGYAENGWSKEAIELFEKIPESGLTPDSIAFIGLLTACSHGGLIDLGFKYFKLMTEKYQINPSKEHHGCMIDLLCRAGRLSEAERMINEMPHQGNDVVWSTLLRACRVNGDVDCGKRAAEKILEKNPNCAGTHITLANIYAEKERWGEVAHVRKAMKSKGVIKEPGWSWIKIKDLVSTFAASDRSHPMDEDIYRVLDLLASGKEAGMKETGYHLVDVGD